MDAERYVKSRIASGALTHTDIVKIVQGFQGQNGLVVDGKPGPITLQRVEEVLSSSTPTPVVNPTFPNLTIEPSEWLLGIDIDHHQKMQPEALDPRTVKFCYVGVTEGTSGRASVDPKFQDHLHDLEYSGVASGVYHFARPSSARRFGPEFGQPLGEAQNFARQWEVAQKITRKMLPPVLDMEDELERLSPRELLDWTVSWCEHCTRLIGRRPIIYTYFSFIHTQLKGYVSELNEYHLWLADYRSSPSIGHPRDIPGWPWLFWQFTGMGAVNGIAGDCDRNAFRGTFPQLKSLLA